VEVDLRGTVVFCNEAYGRIIGRPMDELPGLNYREYMTEDVAETVFAAYNAVYRTGVPNKGFCYEVITKTGARRIIENSISLIIDSKAADRVPERGARYTDRKR
jgi:PAS domain S-box-containing protein